MTESIQKSSVELQLLSLLDPLLKPEGYRIVDLDCRISGNSLLRLYIENIETKSATIGDCTKVSRLLDPVLEASNIFSGPYELEVSSPGIERRLRLISDFKNSVGNEIALDFTERLESLGGKTKALLTAVEGDKISLEFQKKIYEVALSQVKKAQTLFVESKAR